MRFGNITNFKIHLLFLAAGLLEDKAFRKGLVNVYIFHQPIHQSYSLKDERKGSKDYIKVSLV